jgi:outer membrane protein OmpA-like peptidoglycan-associated protein
MKTNLKLQKQMMIKRLVTMLAASLLLCATAHAQTTAQQAKDRAAADANANVGNTIDKTVNGAFDKTGKAIGGLFKKKNKKTAATNTASGDPASANNANTNINTVAGAGASVHASGVAFSDFIPGQTIIFQDDFSQDALADFPAKWNSNGSGKVTTLNGLNGRWLELKMSTAVVPEMNRVLPENATIEFDLYLDAQNGQTTPFIQFGLTQVKDILKEDLFYKDRLFMNIHRYAEQDGHTVEYGLKNDVLGNKSDFPITSYANKVLHVSIALNKTRIRIYLDQTKVLDLPRAITPGMRTNFFLNSNQVIPAPELDMYVGNIRIASAETDARSLLVKQLMESGKAVTNDILFDVNSDVIKSQSYDVVNQFGDALKTNPSLRIKITGHTDSDGNAAANTELSKKRAASVKKYLLTNYGIADTRIQTDGKGASQPVADNSSADGKAKNRRVEFLKL